MVSGMEVTEATPRCVGGPAATLDTEGADVTFRRMPTSTGARPPLFEPLNLRYVQLRNRIAVSAMCQYTAIDGFASDWHLVHLGTRATGGAGLVIFEATAVSPEGRISPFDLGLWSDEHVEPLARIVKFVRSQGSVAALQLAHAGRKASTARPGEGGRRVTEGEGGWTPVAPSAVPFRPDDPPPHALDDGQLLDLLDAFVAATRRAHAAGFQAIELHAAHGYLLHEFLSPLANRRTDRYGGDFEGRTRFPLEVVRAVRRAWPDELPLLVRISATDWVEGGWTPEESVELARRLRALGTDLVDCSTGGLVPHAQIPVAPGYQVEFAERIRREAGILTGAVGLITSPEQANAIVADGKADLVLLARELLRNPYWPHKAAQVLGAPTGWPSQYLRAVD